MSLLKLKFSPIAQINSHVMPIHFKNGATVCTTDKTAFKARIARLRREMKGNR